MYELAKMLFLTSEYLKERLDLEAEMWFDLLVLQTDI
jgi:hypothetical protein